MAKSTDGNEIRIIEDYDPEIIFDYDPGARCMKVYKDGNWYVLCEIPEPKVTPELWDKITNLQGYLNNNNDITITAILEKGNQIIRGFLKGGSE